MLLHTLQNVESHEDISFEVEVDALVIHYLAIECSLVGNALCRQTLVIQAVDVVESAPYLHKPLFEFGGLVLAEIAEEQFQRLHLFFRQIRHVVEFVQVAQIAEHLRRVGHVLVDVVEVGKHYLSPTIEMVECFVAFCHFGVCLIEVAY